MDEHINNSTHTSTNSSLSVTHTATDEQDDILTGNSNEICTPQGWNERAAVGVGTADKLSNNFLNKDVPRETKYQELLEMISDSLETVGYFEITKEECEKFLK
jgi:hypothetical protein